MSSVFYSAFILFGPHGIPKEEIDERGGWGGGVFTHSIFIVTLLHMGWLTPFPSHWFICSDLDRFGREPRGNITLNYPVWEVGKIIVGKVPNLLLLLLKQMYHETWTAEVKVAFLGMKKILPSGIASWAIWISFYYYYLWSYQGQPLLPKHQLSRSNASILLKLNHYLFFNTFQWLKLLLWERLLLWPLGRNFLLSSST